MSTLAEQPHAPPTAARSNAKGVVLALMGAVVMSVLTVGVRIAAELETGAVHPVLVMYASMWLGMIVWAPWVWRQRVRVVPRAWGLNLLRCVCGFAAFSCFLTASSLLPIADAVAISFGVPLIMVVTSVLFLGETVRWRRWTATALGFVGVLVILRPGLQAFDPNYLISLAGVALAGTAVTSMKRLTRDEAVSTLIFSFCLFSVVLAAPATMLLASWPQGAGWAWLLGLASLNVVSQFLFVASFHAGDASVIAPVDYSRMVVSAGLAWVLFAEVPDLWTLVGAGIIIGATLYIGLREARRV